MEQHRARSLFSGLAPALVASALSWGGFFFFYEHAKARWQTVVDVVCRSLEDSIRVDHRARRMPATLPCVFDASAS